MFAGGRFRRKFEGIFNRQKRDGDRREFGFGEVDDGDRGREMRMEE